MNNNEKKPDILYEDKEIIVIRKPAYFPVQSASPGKPDCVSFLKNHLHENGIKNEPYLAIIHRLDEPVEGILVFAKKKGSAAKLSEQLQKGLFIKQYTAAVKKTGPVTGKTDTEVTDEVSDTEKRKYHLIDWMIKEKNGNISKIVPKETSGAKKAELVFKLKESFALYEKEEGYLADIRLYTGRHHQIRLQLKNAGYPVIGDRKYGDPYNGDFPLCLCADRLTFSHPETDRKMEFMIEPSFILRLKTIS